MFNTNWSLSSHYGPSLHHQLTEPIVNLRQLGGRALLALLGIAIGCASVVALLNIGHNAAEEAISTFKDMGSDMLVANIATAEANNQRRLFSTLDSLTLTHSLPAMRHAAPLIVTSVDVRLNGHNVGTIAVGSNDELAPTLGLRVAQGRFLSRYDSQSTYVVLGAKAAIELGASSGSRLQLGDYLFEVVGVLQERGRNPLLPIPVDEAILLPIEGMRRLIPAPEISNVVALARGGDSLPRQAEALQNYLMRLVPNRDVTVQIPQQLLEGMARQSNTFTWLLVGLGGVSLLVGGVGVMNVMVMNVAERRREIGIRMALGARPKDIGRQFLLEAVVLALAGALAGAIFGLVASWLFIKLSGWGFSLSPLSLPLGIASSLVIGLFFGLHPALSAARLEPVRALRDD